MSGLVPTPQSGLNWGVTVQTKQPKKGGTAPAQYAITRSKHSIKAVICIGEKAYEPVRFPSPFPALLDNSPGKIEVKKKKKKRKKKEKPRRYASPFALFALGSSNKGAP